MKVINNLLKENNITAYSYKKNGNVVICDTNIGKIVIKKNSNKNYIYNYLSDRSFNYFPKIINSNSDYVITKYIDNKDIPDEQKINDLTDLLSLLHSKTTHYKIVTEDDYKKIYEDLSNNLEYLKEYYTDLISIIDSKVFMSPSEYLLARNISFIFSSIENDKEEVNIFLKETLDLNKMRISVVHNNINISHYIRDNKNYLISWDKSKIDIPIFDLYNLYNNHCLDFDFIEILKRYEKTYPLKKYELDLFLALINMPSKIEFNDTEYNMCIKISKEIDKLYISHNLLEYFKKSK